MRYMLILLLFAVSLVKAQSGEEIQLDTTVIRGNKELPRLMYIVPWKEAEKNSPKHRLMLHSLFDGTFDPVVPNDPSGIIQATHP